MSQCSHCLKHFDRPWNVQNPQYCCNGDFCQECCANFTVCSTCNKPWSSAAVNDVLISDNTNFQVLHRTSTDNKLVVKWLNDGQLHRDDNSPAEICYYPSGNTYSEKWYRNGQLHHDDDLPALIYYSENGQKLSETWYRNGQQHRDGDLPALIFYDNEGRKLTETWYRNGQQHRDGDRPTVITY